MTQVRKTATYRVVTDSGGGRIFRFYCDISGELCCESKPIRADTEETALELAWEQEGKWEFNLCPKCGKYVSSAMFNVNAGLCLDCAPQSAQSVRSALLALPQLGQILRRRSVSGPQPYSSSVTCRRAFRVLRS